MTYFPREYYPLKRRPRTTATQRYRAQFTRIARSLPSCHAFLVNRAAQVGLQKLDVREPEKAS